MTEKKLESIGYPDGRLVHFTHGSGKGDKMNRLDAIKGEKAAMWEF